MTDRKRPNILWIAFEDTSPFYGCYGDMVARTPNADRLASEGCRYTHGFSTAGVCAPARSAVITGMYPTSIGTHHMRTEHNNPATPEMCTPYYAVPPHYVKCFPEYLRAAGYYCTNNVKSDYQWYPPITTWDHNDTGAHWRNRPDPDQPFFSVFNPLMTHEGSMWPEAGVELTFDPDDMIVPPTFPDTPKVRDSLARMYTQLEKCDQVMGELLQQLEEDGLADNTYVIHWSDHGPLPRGKRWPYDAGIRVPLIVRGPGIEAGDVTNQLVSTVDLAPTVLSLAGLDVPVHMQGQVFLGPDAEESREYIYASRDRHDDSYDMVRAARDRRFKYMRNYRPDLSCLEWVPYRNSHPIVQEMWRGHTAGELNDAQSLMFGPRPVEELYDTEADPWETNNLASDPAHADDLARLRKALDSWIDEVGDLGEISESEMKLRMWPNGEQPQTAPPAFVPICEENPGVTLADGDSTLQGPVLLQLYCATQGASIAYTFEEGEDVRWLLYSRPLRLPEGVFTIRARAIRIGYLESEERSIAFTVKG
jgi:N-sulfoglucosamine sulfohydrolase